MMPFAGRVERLEKAVSEPWKGRERTMSELASSNQAASD